MQANALGSGALVLGLICLAGGCRAEAAPPQRIQGAIGGGVYRLPGNIHRIPAAAQDTGPADPSLVLPRITLHLAMTAAQKSDLQALVRAQQTRGSAEYHHWLNPEQFAERFGANPTDIQKIGAWLESQGFSDVEASRSRTSISFSGTAEQVQEAFGTTLHRIEVNGAVHYANLKNPVLPAALKGMVEGIRGLNNFHPKPHAIRKRAGFRPRFTSSISGGTHLTPADFATIYDINPIYNSGIDGTGETIAVAGQSDIQLPDIAAFRTAAGLPANDPQVVLAGDDPGTNSDDQSESELDLEWAGGIAKNASIVFVNSNDVFTSMGYAIDNNLANVLVITYGACESSVGTAEIASINAELEQANALGITVVAASGDDGAADCDVGTNSTAPSVASQGLAVDFPASSPYVIAVGGTEFNEGSGAYWQPQSTTDIISSALSYIPEMAWNDTVADGSLSATGGGVSSYSTKPSWQAGSGVPADGMRDVPDISFTASPDHDGYLVCSGDGASGSTSVPDCTNGFRAANQDLDVVGGTSAPVPAFAGIVALLDQQSGGRQGDIDANLYSLASISTDVFHDITQGNNIVPCTQGSTNCPATAPMQIGYSAGPGYDLVTGLGSVDAYHLLLEWNARFTITPDPAALTVSPGSTASSTITVAPAGGFEGPVSFSCMVSSGLANTTCSVPGTVSGSGTVTLTVTAGATAMMLHGHAKWPFLAGLGIILLLTWPRKRVRLAAIALACCSLAAVSCGSGNSSTPLQGMTLQAAAESGVVTVTGTAGVMTQTATVSVTVQ
ncbi:MAG TPA: S53 family peptidase [Bryobacteraceae bacterium]